MKWYCLAADQGNPTAFGNIGSLFEFGRGVARDYSKAFEFYLQAVEHGESLFTPDLARCYYYGNGVAQDYAEAARLYLEVAGTMSMRYGDLNNIGILYEYGRGVAQDYPEAVKWYRMSAEDGESDGQNNLGRCYYNGNGVAQDYAEAVKWYRKAAEQGNAYAQYNLGYCYREGIGVAQNYAEAIKWYSKAVEQGNPNANDAMGYCYYYGYGAEQGDAEAVKWYRKAAELGHKEAEKNMQYAKRELDRQRQEQSVAQTSRPATNTTKQSATEKQIEIVGKDWVDYHDEFTTALYLDWLDIETVNKVLTNGIQAITFNRDNTFTFRLLDEDELLDTEKIKYVYFKGRYTYDIGTGGGTLRLDNSDQSFNFEVGIDNSDPVVRVKKFYKNGNDMILY